MDETELIFIEDDERNARERADHRTGSRPFRSRPNRVVVRTPGRSPVVVREPTATVVAAEPEPKRMLGNLTAAEAVEVGAQILAAIQPLPVAPVATGKVETDVENLVLYQGALAVHAKRDEQLRTIGSLIGKLLG
jgi:hypothetical protein